ncbi:MAG: peptidyl-prolyl cis-trans isomerase [Candidatus Omnitrophica bacterium]|nr:peptidyl-prolyl cis-trans isomerase [Candidatus Omnitrophota bacterium]
MKKLNACIFMVIAVFALTFGGCSGGSSKNVLATIDKEDRIALKDFNNRISKLPKRYQEAINKNKKAFLDELIVDNLLYREAMRKKLYRDKDVNDVIEEAKKKILIARLLQDEVENKVNVSDDEVKAYYEANPDKFTTPEVRRASHILVKTEDQARDILVELTNGRNFEDLARARSIDPSANIGGDIGYFTRGQLIPDFEDACFNMEVGEISKIVKTKFGYHIIKLTEKKPPSLKSLPEVRDAIEQSIKRIKKKMAFNDYVTTLKEKSRIWINNKLIDSISETAETPKKD